MIRNAALYLIATSLACWQPLCASEEFSFDYHPGKEPEKSVPRWQGVQKKGNASLEGGKLSVETVIGQRHGYMIGKRSDGEVQGDADAWNLSTGKATVEFRVRCEADFPDVEVFRLHLSDGMQFWTVTFYPNRIAGKNADASQMTTYRATLDDGKLVLSTEADGVIYTRSSGNGSTDTARSAFIGFGTLHSNRESSHKEKGMVRWELEYFRWTNQTAMKPLGKNQGEQ